MKTVLPSITLGTALFFLFHFHAAADPIPYGALALGYTKCVINEHPVAADIASGNNGSYKWFNGRWFSMNTPRPPTITPQPAVS